MTRLVGLVLVLLAVRAHALTFGVGCADPCGQEVIVQGGEATCEMVVGNDGAFALTVTDAAATVQHADGAEVVPVPGFPQTLAPGATETFPFVVGTDPGDDGLPGGILSMDVLAHLMALGIAFDSHFGDQLHVVGTSLCDVTTTTFPVPTTTTTSTSTTSTLPVLLPPRLRVCGHNDNPKKCQ